MRRTSKYFWVAVTWVVILVVAMFSLSFLINVYSSQLSTIYVPKVNGQANLAAPGSEAFWSTVPSESVPLIPSSNYAPSGETGAATVQMAWSNFTGIPVLIVKLQFQNLGSSPSYGSSVPVPYVNDTGYPGGRLIQMYQQSSCASTQLNGTGSSSLPPAKAVTTMWVHYSGCFGGIYPQDAGFYQLATGPGYVYPEQVMVVFGVQPGANTTGSYQVSYKPKMVPGTPGALATGAGNAAEMWLWSSNPTDNSSLDAGYPGMAYPNGTAVGTSSFGAGPHASYAMDGYTNSTAFYQIGGLPGSPIPYINTGGLYSQNSTDLAAVRQFMNPFMVQSKGVYNSATNTWTVEFVRALRTSALSKYGEDRYQLQMNPASSSDYYLAFAVSQGRGSETYLLYYNSVSFWWAFNFQTNNGFGGYSNQYGHPANPSP